MAVLILLFIINTGIFLGIMFGVLPVSFTRIESEITKDASSRLVGLLRDDLSDLSAAIKEYSSWDDTYFAFSNYTEGSADTYWSTNIACTYIVPRYHFVGVYLDGVLVKNITCTAQKQLIETLSEFAVLPTTHPLLRNRQSLTPTTGMLKVGPQTFLLTSSPIATTDETLLAGPTMVFGKRIGSAILKTYADKAQVCASIYNVTNPMFEMYQAQSNAATPVTLNMSLTTENVPPFLLETFFTNNPATLRQRECWQRPIGAGNQTTNEERISAFQIILDMFGTRAFLTRVDIPRNINSLAYQSFAIATGLIGGVSLITGAVILIFVEILVLRAIFYLSNFVLKIASSNDSAIRIPIGKCGYDELTEMARHINSMLETIDSSQKKIKEQNSSLQVLLQKTGVEEQKSRTIMNAIPDYLITVKKTNGAIINANNAFLHMFKFTPAEISDGTITILSLFHKESNYGTYNEQEMMSELNHLSSSQSSVNVEMCTRLGVNIPVALTSSKGKIVSDDGVEFEVFVVLCRNISEQKLYQANFEQQEKQIEALQRSLEFENMLKNPTLREEFKQYCKKEMSAENMMFLEAVEQYKSLKTHERGEKAKDIVKQFLSDTSATQLNISKQIRDNEMFAIQHGYGQVDLFDGLEQAVRINMINDTFARFMKQHPQYQVVQKKDVKKQNQVM